MNLNKVFIIGNLTRDPELKNLPSGTPVASFGVATNRVWKNAQGGKEEEVEFHNIVVFGRQAEIVKQYLVKGRAVFIEGRIKTRNWDAQDGSKRNRTEIIAERIQFGPRVGGQDNFGGPRQSGNEFRQNQNKESPDPALADLPAIDVGEGDIKEEDLPF